MIKTIIIDADRYKEVNDRGARKEVGYRNDLHTKKSYERDN